MFQLHSGNTIELICVRKIGRPVLFRFPVPGVFEYCVYVCVCVCPSPLMEIDNYRGFCNAKTFPSSSTTDSFLQTRLTYVILHVTSAPLSSGKNLDEVLGALATAEMSSFYLQVLSPGDDLFLALLAVTFLCASCASRCWTHCFWQPLHQLFNLELLLPFSFAKNGVCVYILHSPFHFWEQCMKIPFSLHTLNRYLHQ